MSYLTKANASPFTPIQIENPDLNLTIPEVDESILTDDQSGIMSKIRVSRRNKSILEKLGFEDPVAKAVLQFSPEQVNHMVEEEVRARRRGYTGSNLGESLLKPEQKRGYIENGSCFM